MLVGTEGAGRERFCGGLVAGRVAEGLEVGTGDGATVIWFVDGSCEALLVMMGELFVGGRILKWRWLVSSGSGCDTELGFSVAGTVT